MSREGAFTDIRVSELLLGPAASDVSAEIPVRTGEAQQRLHLSTHASILVGGQGESGPLYPSIPVRTGEDNEPGRIITSCLPKDEYYIQWKTTSPRNYLVPNEGAI